MTTIFGANVTKHPVILCGRPVWVSEAGHSIKEVWVHTNLHNNADLYFCGSSLGEGDQPENLAHLEGLCRDYIATLPPISRAMQKVWEAHKAETDKPEWLRELELDAAGAVAVAHPDKREITREDVDAHIRDEKDRRGYHGPHNVFLG